MIIVRIIGGLGNQMFQYALYRALQEKGIEVKADLSDFGKEGLTRHNGYELERIFKVSLKEASQFELDRLKNNKSLLYYFRRLGNLLFSSPLHHYRQENIDLNSLKDNKTQWYARNAYLDGYWQSEEYFHEIRSKIMADFSFPVFQKEKNINLATEIKSKDSVSIHVRGGDYISTPELFNHYGCICNQDYYNKAIEYIKSNVGHPHFYLFTNDTDWVSENIDLKRTETTLVDWNEGLDSYRDMQLMSLCRHQILANSSFSWWASYLNRQEGISISPDKWTAQDNHRDIFLSKWHQL